MLRAISPSLKKYKRATCAVNDRVHAPPKRNHSTCSLTLLPYPHMKAKGIYFCIYELKKTIYSNQTGCFPQVSSLGNKYIMVIHELTATLYGRRPSRTTPAANLSWPKHKPWSECKKRALSQNTKSWTTKHQQHTRRPAATPI